MLTVGHGTLEQDQLGALLAAAGVDLVVDVRRYPGSRRSPHVNREALARWLPARAIGYRWEEALGGRRRGQPGSPHTAIRNASFRAYADHMHSAEWRQALAVLLEEAGRRTVAVMCSESVWWRCHRRFIADACTLVHDVEVGNLMHDGRVHPHRVTDGARLAGDRIVYDAGAGKPSHLSLGAFGGVCQIDSRQAGHEPDRKRP